MRFRPCRACRVFGASFAEMPFVATREGYRREGNLRRLVQASSMGPASPMPQYILMATHMSSHATQGIEERLGAAGVQWLVLPSVRALLPMWTLRFGCQPLTLAEAQALDSRIVAPDADSAQLLKKALQRACAGPEPR